MNFSVILNVRFTWKPVKLIGFDLAITHSPRLQRKLPSMPTKSRPSALETLWWQDMQLDGGSWK
jgi:hypothetical protein